MLQGKQALERRLNAIRKTGQPIARKWAKSTAASARRRVPVKTGRLQRSIRVKTSSERGAVVVGHYSAAFVDKGTVAHDEPKRRRRKIMRYGGPGGQPVFAKRVHHPATRARPFKAAAAHDGFRDNPMASTLIDLWNSAA